jgi:hypothetical protein
VSSAVDHFHEARETLTDAEGRFAIDAKPNWALRSVDREPDIIVFKPGNGAVAEVRDKVWCAWQESNLRPSD